MEVEPDASTGFESIFLSVEDRTDGAQVEIFYQTYDLEDGGWFDERAKWEADLNYHGGPENIYDQISGWLDGRWSHVFTGGPGHRAGDGGAGALR